MESKETLEEYQARLRKLEAEEMHRKNGIFKKQPPKPEREEEPLY
jgi:hypothetical protein